MTIEELEMEAKKQGLRLIKDYSCACYNGYPCRLKRFMYEPVETTPGTRQKKQHCRKKYSEAECVELLAKQIRRAQ